MERRARLVSPCVSSPRLHEKANMLRHLAIAAFTLLCTATGSAAAELKILPSEVPLTGPHAGQRLLVVSEDGGRVTADLTGKAKFASSNPAVAKVDEDGSVRAVGDGQAVVTATDGQRQASTKVRVSGTKAAHTWSFRNHVIPV